jgi:hypothetical protein
MDRARVILCLSIPVLLAGCDIGDGVMQGEESGSSSAAVDRADERSPNGVLDRIHYRYDPAQLITTEVQVRLPPDYENQFWATKLISASRAALLGQDQCRYGESERLQTCLADKEPGLMLALLERPLADYHAAFVEAGLQDELSPTHLDGSEGFTFSDGAGGSGIEYRFLPFDERTVLVARQFVASHRGNEEAIGDVIRSFAQGMENAGA